MRRTQDTWTVTRVYGQACRANHTDCHLNKSMAEKIEIKSWVHRASEKSFLNGERNMSGSAQSCNNGKDFHSEIRNPPDRTRHEMPPSKGFHVISDMKGYVLSGP